MTLTDMYRPEECTSCACTRACRAKTARTTSPRRCRTSCAQWPRREDKGSRHISPRSRATARPWKARRWPRSCTAALGWTPESEASPHQRLPRRPPRPPFRWTAKMHRAPMKRRPGGHALAPVTIAPVRVQPAAHGKLGRRRGIALRVAVRIPGGFPVRDSSAEPSEKPGASPRRSRPRRRSPIRRSLSTAWRPRRGGHRGEPRVESRPYEDLYRL